MNDDPNTVLDLAGGVSIGENLALAVGLDPDGTETFWVARLDRPDDAVHGCWCATCAPHDQLRPKTTA